MSDIANMMGIDPALSRMASADAAMIKARAGLDAKKMADIEAAANDFEAVFVAEMLRPMFETVETDSFFGGGQAEESWRGLMVDEYGKQIARAGGIGLSADIKAKMIQMQAEAQATGE